MDNKAKLSIYIEELKADGPIAVVDAQIGECMYKYIRHNDVVTHLNENNKNNNLINWYIHKENNIKEGLDYNKKVHENQHIIQPGDNKVHGHIMPFSFHTFLFPFLWKDDNKVKTRKEFIKCLNLDNWKPDTIDSTLFSEIHFTEKYNQYHYFNSAARNAIYSVSNADEELVWNYRYSLPNDAKWIDQFNGINNKAKYVIEIDSPKDNSKDEINGIAKLSLNGIRLKLFNTGIGILIIETENYTYKKIESINKINDFGRRIYMPFCKDNSKTCPQCAKDIYLEYASKSVFELDPYGIQNPEFFHTTRIAKFIKELFTNKESFTNNSFTITTDKKESEYNKNTFYIEPIIDDRMYVACYYINNNITSAMKVWDNNNYAYIDAIINQKSSTDNGFNVAQEIYKYTYIDGSDLTCQSKNLLSEMLGKKYIYDRWIEWGSLTGITEYSMVTITSSTWDVLFTNFLAEYIEMAILALAQRASLLNFERRISDSTLKKSDIRDIHKEYLLFQSQLLLKEVTPQQQGIELYKMMIDNLFINEQVAEIENQIEDAFAQKTADNESRENIILFILAILSIFEATNTLLPWIFPEITDCTKAIIAGVFCVVAIVWYIVVRKK